MSRDHLRRVAATRPGYATYPTTEQGSPSWWRRPLPGEQPAPETANETPAATTRDRLDPLPPTGTPDHGTAPTAVVDEQHTWTTDDVERVCKALGIPVQPWQALLIRQLFAEPPSSVRRPPEPTGFITTAEPPPRWWQRFTRRRSR